MFRPKHSAGVGTTSCFRFAMLCCIGLLWTVAHERAKAAVLIETQLPGVEYIGRTDSTIPDPANASANAAAVSSVGSVSLNGVLTAYTATGSGGYTIVTDVFGHLLRLVDSLGRSVINLLPINLADSPPSPLHAVTNAVASYSLSYNTAGRITKTERSDGGNVTTYQYDSSNRIVGSTDRAGHVVQYQYDSGNNRLQTVTEPGPFTTQYQYDGLNRPIQSINQSSNTTLYSYDSANRLISSDRAGNVTTYTYDGSSNRIQTLTDPPGNVSTYTYDGANRLIQQQTNPAALLTTYLYDGVGNLIRRTDPGSIITDYTYDSYDRLIRRTEGSSITQYAYDSIGRLSSVTDPGGGSTSFTYAPELSSFLVWAAIGATLFIRRRSWR